MEGEDDGDLEGELLGLSSVGTFEGEEDGDLEGDRLGAPLGEIEATITCGTMVDGCVLLEGERLAEGGFKIRFQLKAGGNMESFGC